MKTHKTFKRYCETCDELFQPIGKYSKYCEKCRYLKNKLKWEKYRIAKEKLTTKLKNRENDSDSNISITSFLF